MTEEYLTIAEVAKRLGISRQRAYDLERTKVIPSVRLHPNRPLVKASDLVGLTWNRKRGRKGK